MNISLRFQTQNARLPYKEKCSVAAFNQLDMDAQSRPIPPEHDPHHAPHKISKTAARKMLGMVGRNYSDEDMGEVLDALYGIAEESYELYQDIGCPSDQEE